MKKRTRWTKVYSPHVGMVYLGGSDDTKLAHQAELLQGAVREGKLAKELHDLQIGSSVNRPCFGRKAAEMEVSR